MMLANVAVARHPDADERDCADSGDLTGRNRGPFQRGLRGENSGAPGYRAVDDPAPRQLFDIQRSGIRRKIGEMHPTSTPGTQQALERSEIGAAFQLRVQREYMITRRIFRGQGEQMIHRIHAVEIRSTDQLVERRQCRRQLRNRYLRTVYDRYEWTHSSRV